MMLLFTRGHPDGDGAWLKCSSCRHKRWVRNTHDLTGRQAFLAAVMATNEHHLSEPCRGVMTWDDGSDRKHVAPDSDRVPRGVSALRALLARRWARR